MSVNKDLLDKYENIIKKDRKYSTLQHLMSSLKNSDFDIDRSIVNKIEFKFNKELIHLPVTNQYHSGRCWIFAALNIMRRNMITKYKLNPSFELSQSYIFLYDKIEKCNIILEIIYNCYKKDKNYINTLEYKNIVSLLLSDGGTWNMFSAIAKKYGVCPKEYFPDNIHCRNTSKMNSVLYKVLAKGSFDIFDKHMDLKTFKKHKQNVMFECYKILRLFIGEPPSEFQWKGKTFDPILYYQKIVKPLVNVDEYVSICCIPNYEPNTVLGQKYVFNVVLDGNHEYSRISDNKYINLDSKTFQNCIKNSISKKRTAVWFACDYSECLFKNSVLDKTSCVLDEIFDLDFNISKEKLISSNLTIANHAMIICGYNQESDNTISRWKVENSHGATESLYNGYLVMTTNWLEDYGNIAAVHISCLPESSKSQVNKKPKLWLDFWNYLGFVAKY